MLADNLAEFVDSNLRGMALFPEHVTAHQAYLDKVKKSPRFVLDRTSNFMINDLKNSTTPSKLVSILSMCRLPFPTMWVEFPFQDRTDWVAQAREKGYYTDHKVEADPPKRLGFLLEQVDDTTITIHPTWAHDSELVNVCPMALRIDFEDRGTYVPSEDERKAVTDRDVQNSWTQSWIGKPEEVDACADLQTRITNIVPPDMTAMMDRIKNQDVRIYKTLEMASIYDLAGEWHFIILLLCLLNSRNIVQYGDEVTYEPLNKQRAKKGKPPLLSHRPIVISLSKVQRNRTQWGGSGTGASRAASLVMGHLKVRKTGIFWWGPHVREGRGDAKPREYRVVA